ncbi:MAG TPA: NADH:ubiquinone oxidoreductase [Candidatus Marinimicrobia bacterium]|nr:MAG: NADH:ubiquinone oxidoreductase [Candidatus Marinimicrobia bacterium CG1_02_48_14]PIZ61945.1 MAG: NADH:ubiquinone oxidoreductase [Candidatus Marinimicrobia bacterium CG_4_10_14_0_2_um_filter_48_9]PJA51636.1 MAG: NADH:ubiquinone oxidoreductase [Candidatus Marinimicrobia bacterium CG_4_9_14_3_um_filter_48_9]HCW76172.1 NADH:ubiquinone oxidoreductase [Candidatus Neomarinimicrobiota bacterium]
MFNTLKILFHHGRQSIPNVATAELPGIFRGRPVITNEKIDTAALVKLCPTGAIGSSPISIDLGKCTFCGECAFAFPNKITFTKDYKLATNSLERLIVTEGTNQPVLLDASLIRSEISKYFSGSLKLRQVSAGGDNSCEMELNACGNVNFDMGRFGIEFVASPRHADGIVITGPLSENMALPLQICYDAIPEPKIIILAGTDAISGGIFSGSPALNRHFLNQYKIDLYVPGNPIHPLTFINGVLDLIRTNPRHT